MALSRRELDLPHHVIKDHSRLSLPSRYRPPHTSDVTGEHPLMSSRFPSLPATQDLVSVCHRAACDVLEAYVINQTPRTAPREHYIQQTSVQRTPSKVAREHYIQRDPTPVTDHCVQRTPSKAARDATLWSRVKDSGERRDRSVEQTDDTPVTQRTMSSRKQTWRQRTNVSVSHAQQATGASPTPVRRKFKENRKQRRLVATPKINSHDKKHKKKIVVDVPYVTSQSHIHHQGDTWSPTEERKLTELWRESTEFSMNLKAVKSDRQKEADKRLGQGQEKHTVNHMYRFSNVTQGEPHVSTRFRSRLSTALEPPKVMACTLKYINTWLEAGADVPDFLKSV